MTTSVSHYIGLWLWTEEEDSHTVVPACAVTDALKETSSGLQGLASAALARLHGAQGDGSILSIPMTEPANPSLLNIPGFASFPSQAHPTDLGAGVC